MIYKRFTKTSISILVVFVALTLFLAACGGKPTPVPSSTPTTISTSATTATSSTVDAVQARGEQLYQKTAGGAGCQICHGADGKGKPDLAPGIRGKTAADIKSALTLTSMKFISLSDDDIAAIAVYLKYLQAQP